MATILVVDDREVNLKLLRGLLEPRGYRVLAARDGEEALEQVRSELPDLVITDVLMPRMDGYEFVRRLRAEPAIAATRVIYYTAHFREQEAVSLAQSLGVIEVLIKPSPLERVLLAVDRALAQALVPARPQDSTAQFDRAHMRLIADKLAERAASLRLVKHRLQAEVALRAHTEGEVRRLSYVERHVVERTAELQRANRELEAFAHSVSHDPRAPLRDIDGYARRLEESASLDAKSGDYARAIADAARRVGEMVEGLLGLSRIGRMELRNLSVDMALLVQGLQRQLVNAGDKLAEDWDVGTLPSVVGDPVLLELVWTNLLSNAMKYSSRHAAPKIEVGAQVGDNGETIFFVRDNGVGFDGKYSERLFTPFGRLQATDNFEGTGIGLATVHRIIERHGGRVWAESSAGAGATFYFTVGPAALADRERPAAREAR